MSTKTAPIRYFFSTDKMPDSLKVTSKFRKIKLMRLAYIAASSIHLQPSQGILSICLSTSIGEVLDFNYVCQRARTTFVPDPSLYGASLSEVHATTAFAGKVVEDPMGLHVTVNFKTQEHLDRQRHVTCHGYVISSRPLEF
ncbi:uncharacterized protein CPUR_02039 [Claviceps purpurea 20.1]|uniref:Uncharacterized protein n=1 Tax=Claviceps purpurea (strain 20.1) TaxID=1111077 RepID=M1WIT5_CLAP2|nr:uncharacterized protein CPUR_02039 [Claviceps purpurea 20.1]